MQLINMFNNRHVVSLEIYFVLFGGELSHNKPVEYSHYVKKKVSEIITNSVFEWKSLHSIVIVYYWHITLGIFHIKNCFWQCPLNKSIKKSMDSNMSIAILFHLYYFFLAVPQQLIFFSFDFDFIYLNLNLICNLY